MFEFRKIVGLGLMLGLAACGGSSSSSDDSSDSAALSDVSSLPKATSPVVGADGSLSVLPKSLSARSVSKLNLGDYDEFDFSGSSRAACEAGNVLKEAVSAAAQGDLILCYVQNIAQQNIDSGNLADNNVDIYDGEFHVFTLAFDESEEDDGQGPSKVRMKITKDADGNISDFVMQACSTDSQSEYLHQAISGTDFTMTSKGLYDGGGGSTGTHQVSVTGTLNSSGQFTGKTISISSSYSAGDGGAGSSEGTVTQDATTFTFSGSQAGEWGNGTYENRLYFESAVDDTNTDLDSYDIGLLGYGAGAVQGAFEGTYDGNDDGDTDDENETYTDDGFAEAWDADMTQEESNDFSAGVAAATLPEAVGEVSLSFDGDEAYADCAADDAEVELTVDMAGLDTECSALTLGHEWTDCHSIGE